MLLTEPFRKRRMLSDDGATMSRGRWAREPIGDSDSTKRIREDERGDSIGPPDRYGHGGPTTHRLTDDVRSIDVQSVQQSDQIAKRRFRRRFTLNDGRRVVGTCALVINLLAVRFDDSATPGKVHVPA